MGIDECPNSFVPYVSVSCHGPWCINATKPCSKSVAGDCGGDGLVCRELFPGLIRKQGTDQMLDWLVQWK